jgi:FlaA1/EpsC-like NDP-sugar epimerase
MAKDMIHLFGLKPFEDIDIVFTGIRPGEKLFEELETEGENLEKTTHPKIFIGKLTAYPLEQIETAVSRFEKYGVLGRERELRAFLNDFLPEARVAVL